MKNKEGFTLAEVLITLSILGVVAAISIPSIINNYQKQATVSRLKMAYSMLDRLTQISYIENGYPYSLKNEFDIYPNFHRYFGKYLNIEKDCGTFTSSTRSKAHGCFKDDTYKRIDNYDLKNEATYGSTYTYQVLLKNDMSLGVWTAYNTYSMGTIFVVDIDGPNRGPSKLGADVFMFTYSNKCPNGNGTLLIGGVSPTTCSTPTRTTALNSCKKGATNVNAVLQRGATCSTLIIMDGWKISSDYPWSYAHKK